MGHDQDIDNIKKSIQSLNQLSSDEKKNLLESIEMLWLNASVRKKKVTSEYLKMQMKTLSGYDNFWQQHGQKI